jgi:uncharacterized protein (DUF983 family)
MFKTKCPHCGAKLGDFLYAAACPHCQAALAHNQADPTPVPVMVARPKSWPVRAFACTIRLMAS